MKKLPTTVVAVLLALGLTGVAVFAAAAAPPGGSLPAPAAAAQAKHPPASARGTAEQAGETETTTETDETAAAAAPHPANHGGTVSAAAQATTPAGCANHGQFVSLVARGLYDQAAPCVTPAPDVTSESGQGNGQAGQHGKALGRHK